MSNKQNQNQSIWKWSASFDQAAKVVQEIFNITPDTLKKAGKSDTETKKLIQSADASDVDVQRTRDAISAQRKLITNANKIDGMVHGFIRGALDLVYSRRKNESKTAKQLSKFTANVAILDARTNKAAQKDYHRMGAAIGEINESTERDKEVITAQYQSIGEVSQAKTQQALIDIQARQQRRIEGSKKPWKS
jgi:uncharacterized protein YicC (UPF0701 family)